jgi:hypothetical protein
MMAITIRKVTRATSLQRSTSTQRKMVLSQVIRSAGMIAHTSSSTDISPNHKAQSTPMKGTQTIKLANRIILIIFLTSFRTMIHICINYYVGVAIQRDLNILFQVFLFSHHASCIGDQKLNRISFLEIDKYFFGKHYSYKLSSTFLQNHRPVDLFMRRNIDEFHKMQAKNDAIGRLDNQVYKKKISMK